MKRSEFFKKLRSNGTDLRYTIARTVVAADLHGAMVAANLNQSKLASKLGWSRARVSQVLSGDENLTLETIAQIADACGLTFDVAFRRVSSTRATQPWETSIVKTPNQPHMLMIKLPGIKTQGSFKHESPRPTKLDDIQSFNFDVVCNASNDREYRYAA